MGMLAAKRVHAAVTIEAAGKALALISNVIGLAHFVINRTAPNRPAPPPNQRGSRNLRRK